MFLTWHKDDVDNRLNLGKNIGTDSDFGCSLGWPTKYLLVTFPFYMFTVYSTWHTSRPLHYLLIYLILFESFIFEASFQQIGCCCICSWLIISCLSSWVASCWRMLMYVCMRTSKNGRNRLNNIQTSTNLIPDDLGRASDIPINLKHKDKSE